MALRHAHDGQNDLPIYETPEAFKLAIVCLPQRQRPDQACFPVKASWGRQVLQAWKNKVE